MLKKSSCQSVSPLAPELIAKTNALSKKRRFSSRLIKVVAVLTASLTLACGLPISAIAAPYTADIACTTGAYHIEAGEVTGNASCTGVLNIGSGITKILANAFLNNLAITDVIIASNDLESIGDAAFKGNTNLQNLQLANGIFWIGSFAFQNDIALRTIDLGTHLGQINRSAFQGCTGITSLTLPNSLTSIGVSAFSGATHLTSIVIPNSVTSVGTSAFSGASSLSSVTLGNGLTTLSAATFLNNTHLTSVTFGTAITSIGANAFLGNTLLASITIPSRVTSIGSLAFDSTSALTSYTYCGSADLTDTGLIGKTNLCVTVPDAPTIGTATSTGTTTATVAFTAPGSDGGSTILSYTATSTPGSITATLTQAGSGTISITGLSPTTSYTFTIIAHNAIGNSVASSASNSITTLSNGVSALFSSPSYFDYSFTLQVTNFDATYTYAVTTSAGAVTINSKGLVTVTGLSPDQSATVTVTSTRTGYASGSASTSGRAQVAPMRPGNKPVVTITPTAITCTIGSYSATPTSSIFSLFVDGTHISTIFSALGDYLPDYLASWATPATITRTGTLTSATWAFSDSYKGKAITCATVAYSKNALGSNASEIAVVS